MRTLLVTMTGVGFTLGVVFGLLMQLPIDNTLPADSVGHDNNNRLSNSSSFRPRRSLKEEQLQYDMQVGTTTLPVNYSEHLIFSQPNIEENYISFVKQKLERANINPFIKSEPIHTPFDVQHKSTVKVQQFGRQFHIFSPEEELHEGKSDSLALKRISKERDVGASDHKNTDLNNTSSASKVVSIKLNLHKRSVLKKENLKDLKSQNTSSLEDFSYMASIVDGIIWTPQLEKSCPRPFMSSAAENWKKQVQGLDVVKMEEGCGRMQNRLVTFRDASKACVRYRMNTDQIQGEIYSYYLGRLLNMTNIPPTVLARVDALSSKWRTVHLKMSLAQWADSKIVVLTQYIDDLSASNIPTAFREVNRRLEPTLKDLGAKSHSELCELVQWSDLIVFDYLTANLDRVINNMFNRQWNDQMMSSPAHNLERQPGGGLVFLDNESGLFHGYRLLDKYSSFHRSLLHALCVFKDSTVKIIKRLHESSSIGKELHALFASNEVLHNHLTAISDKNVKILQQRLSDVYQQIIQCERLFNR